MKMLFEHIVAFEPQKCIYLSECLERSEESVANMEEYLVKFREMLSLLNVHQRTPLKKQPLFVWQDRNSACWKFEEHRILHTLHGMLLQDAKRCFDNCDYKGAKVFLGRGVETCKEMLGLEWFKTPLVRGMPELQTSYMLSLLFRTKGTYCFNMHSWKSTPAVAKMAYQFVELSNCLWRRGADMSYANKLCAHYHHTMASTEAEKEEKNFEIVFSHSSAAVELLDDPKMLEDHTNWVEMNNTVHYAQTINVECPTFTLQKALKLAL